MNTMIKTAMIGAAIAAALTTMTAPAIASAQPLKPVAVAYHDRFDSRATAELNSRITTLQTRINMGSRSHQLSIREAARLNGQLSSIISTKRSFERSGRGLDGREVATLNGRLDTLSSQVRVQAHDRNRS